MFSCVPTGFRKFCFLLAVLPLENRLVQDGEDPGEFNFEGTELEKKVTNKGTNALIVREFMEECIKDSNGVLPGKTIFFAISKKHAYRLC